ncbi:MAG: NUDIX hydrolase [Candidatus Pacearchaeota archaeon]|jgi:8-oxo-dGTP diphosphatase
MFQFPIPVVRIILEDSEDRILLLRRSNKSRYKKGEYCLPGGKVKYGQTIEKACIDEVETETRLEISNLEFLFYQDNLPGFSDMHLINLYFSANHSGKVQINNESSSSAWVHPNKLHKYKIAFKNKKGIERYLKIKKI